MPESLLKTPFYQMHVDADARMVPFAGYEMPVQYDGIKAEHLHTRAAAGLFDVSHMGQLLISGETAQQEIERLVPVDLDTLDQDQMCLTFLTNERGGILDDLIITKRSDHEFFLVVNGACKNDDMAHIKKHLVDAKMDYFGEQALLALQGPKACDALCRFLPDMQDVISNLTFMRGVGLNLETDEDDFDIYVSRSGYTGEDGFELSMPAEFASAIANELLSDDVVEWVGLGARDSLRLEAGLCLYGHDLDESTTPVEAGFVWSIDKSRRAGGAKEGGFLGAEVILKQMADGVSRRRRGFLVNSRVPVREGADLVNASGENIGRITSGGVAPSFDGLIAMGYIATEFLTLEHEKIFAVVRGKQHPLSIHPMPFVQAKYKR